MKTVTKPDPRYFHQREDAQRLLRDFKVLKMALDGQVMEFSGGSGRGIDEQTEGLEEIIEALHEAIGRLESLPADEGGALLPAEEGGVS